jgi:hypothetical protein
MSCFFIFSAITIIEKTKYVNICCLIWNFSEQGRSMRENLLKIIDFFLFHKCLPSILLNEKGGEK